jgi:hypothetical protein
MNLDSPTSPLRVSEDVIATIMFGSLGHWTTNLSLKDNAPIDGPFGREGINFGSMSAVGLADSNSDAAPDCLGGVRRTFLSLRCALLYGTYRLGGACLFSASDDAFLSWTPTPAAVPFSALRGHHEHHHTFDNPSCRPPCRWRRLLRARTLVGKKEIDDLYGSQSW